MIVECIHFYGHSVNLSAYWGQQTKMHNDFLLSRNEKERHQIDGSGWSGRMIHNVNFKPRLHQIYVTVCIPDEQLVSGYKVDTSRRDDILSPIQDTCRRRQAIQMDTSGYNLYPRATCIRCKRGVIETAVDTSDASHQMMKTIARQIDRYCCKCWENVAFLFIVIKYLTNWNKLSASGRSVT